MYKNYVFDFGRVLIDFNTEIMTSPYVKNKKDIKTIADVVFDRKYWNLLDSGDITDDEVKSLILKRLPKELHTQATDTYNNWYKNLPEVDGMVKLIEDIKACGKKLYLLSNISYGFAKNYASVDRLKYMLSLFDGLVFSGQIHMVKPEKEIFLYLLDRYSLKPNECFFVDDNPLNTAAADLLGFSTYQFNFDEKSLRKHIFNDE